MEQGLKQLSDEELVRNLVNGYLNSHYQISLDDLNAWYGLKYCRYVTELQYENFEFLDMINSSATHAGATLINIKEYFDLESIHFEPGDVVLDIGANIGIFSIYLAKKYPFLKIYAFEPVNTSYQCFLANIDANNVQKNVINLTRKAVTFDGKEVSMIVNTYNSKDVLVADACKEGYIMRPDDRFIPSTTLDDIFEDLKLEKVKLLKMDCNGDEHEILKYCSVNNLKKVENLVGEFYESEYRPDRNNEELIKYCKGFIKKVKVLSR